MKLKKIIDNKEKAIKITISLLILIFLLKFMDFQLLLKSIKSVNILFLLALIIIPFSILLRAWRWMIILNKGGKIVSIKDSYVLTLVGIALNIFLPASFGDVAKSYYGYKWHGPKEEMLSSSIVDKFVALLSVFVIGSLAAFLFELYILSIFSLTLALLFLIMIFFPKIMPWGVLNKLFFIFIKIKLDEGKLASSFRLPNRIKLITLFISIFAWIITYFQFFIICQSFYIKISLIYILAVAPLINLAVLFPFTLNGLGSGEAVMAYLFGLIHIPPTLAILVSFLYSQILTTLIPGLFGYLIIMLKK